MTTSKTASFLRAALLLAAFSPLAASGAILTQSFDLNASAISGQTLNGLSARATFTLDTDSPTTLTILLQNTSTSAPVGTLAAAQILTAVSFDLGDLGANAADPRILGGSVVIAPGSASVNFSNSPVLSGGANISGEWGYGNEGSTSMMINMASAMSAHTTAFGGTNLDGTAGLDGPQGGLVAVTPVVDLGGTGAVADSVIITLTLDKSVADLSFLSHGVQAEFGSDFRVATTPEPVTLVTVALGGVVALLRRRR